MKTAISEMLIDITVKPTSPAPTRAAWTRPHARLEIAGDVLEHDDRVVDDEAGRDGQRHQGQDVEAEARQIHCPERADDRERHRDRRNEGRANVAQKEENDQRDEPDRDRQGPFGVLQRSADRVASVGGERHVDRGRHRGEQVRQLRLDGVDGLDDVCAGLAKQQQDDAGLAVDEPLVAQILDGIGDVGDVGEVDRRAVAVCDDERTVIGGVVRLIVGVDLQMLAIALDGALRAVGVGGGERRAHVFKADAIFRKGVRVELDAHGGQRRAADGDLADAVKLGKPLLQDIAGRIVHLARRHRLRRQVEQKDRRVGGVDLAVDRVAAQAGRQVGVRRVDRRLNIARRAVDVAVEVELKRDAACCRCELVEVISVTSAMLAERALERTCDAGGDRVRACAGQRACTEIVGKSTSGNGETGRMQEGEGARKRDADGRAEWSPPAAR